MTRPAATSAPAGRCPVCGRPAAAEARPFCSLRCAEVDLGRWLTGEYRIPAGADAEADESDRPPPPDLDPT